MKVIYGIDQLHPPLPQSVLTVGNFDGVHVGHQEILKRARSFATQTGCPVAVLTFDPHPLAVVSPAKAPLRLMSVTERVQRLAECGAEIVVVAQSQRALLSMEADDFIADILMARFHPKHIVEGPSFGFGKGRKGTPELLREKTKPFGCEVHIVEPVSIEGENGASQLVSSSMIRKLLMEGEVSQAARCLGRQYAIESTVIYGAGRGRSIGVATANIHTPEGQVEPAEGVYAGTTVVGDAAYPSAISIGRAETFGKNKRQVESHLLDFQGDLYGKTIRVEFARRIRGQQKFESVDELIKQIQQDIQSVRTTNA
jgi:riboflavin kinase/FMN adenylyltransferase